MSFGVSPGDIFLALNLANKLRKDFVDAPRQFNSISEDVRFLSIILQDVDIQLPGHELDDHQHKQLGEIAHSCHNLLKTLEYEISKCKDVTYDGKSLPKRLTSAWKKVSWEPKDLRELQDRLLSNVTLLQSFLGAISSQTVAATKQILNQIDHRQEDKEETKIFNWLTATDYTSQQSDLISRRQAGTGQWLLDSDEYANWIRTRQSSLLGLGIPGAGKTICSAIIIDDLTGRFEYEQDVGIAYLYCNFKRQEEQKIEDLLASLLKQLGQRMLNLPDPVKDLYNRCKHTSTRPRLGEMSKALHAVVSLHSQVFIVIDALDECQSADGCRAMLLAEMMKLRNEAGANIFATSRPTEIDECLKGTALLEIRAHEDDVRRYLSGNMFKLPGFVSRNVPLQEEIESTICRQVQGMFLLAQLHFESLIGKRSAKSTRTALKELSGGTDKHAYDNAYDQAMQRIKGQLPEQQELAIQSLSWVTFAKRPLTVMELQHALAIEEGESDLDEENIPQIEDVLSVCAGLLTYESGIVRLVHYTAQEYFERTHTCWFSGFSATHICNLCVTYLLFDIFGTGPCETNEAFDDRLRGYPLYDYVAHHWGSHAREAQKFDPEVTEFLEDEAKVEASIQALNVTRGHSFESWSQKFPKGMKGLHLAAYRGVHQLVALLLQRLHFVDMRDNDGYTPLIQASMAGHPAVINLLLANGAYFDAAANNNTTPLYWTALNGDEETVRLLLELGANVDFSDRIETALMAASGEGHLRVVGLLLARGADINRSDELFGTSLERASAEGHLQTVELLLKKGAEVSEGAFESASEWDQEDVIKILLEKTTGIRGQSANYGAALHRASTRGNQSIVQMLLNNNADINAQSNQSETPLLAASAAGNSSMVQFLLSRGADVDGRGRLHGTALQAASAKGHRQIVQILLRHGADPRIRGGIHKTALRAARLRGHREIADMLERHQEQLPV